MDTRYWGPPGWKLLHLIAHSAKAAQMPTVRRFFNTVAYILPCKYCRKSFSEYIVCDPIPQNVSQLPRWLWRIHNKVNGKLRDQGLKVEEDPPFYSVKKSYEDLLSVGCTRTNFEGWEFLFSVAEAHPLSRTGRASVPIKDHPAIESVTDPLEKNRWNIMLPEERHIFYTEFWKLLPEVLPFSEWTAIWKRSATAISKCRKECLKQLWAIRRALENELDLLNRTTYHSLCKEIQRYRSNCTRSMRGKTCRKKRSHV